MKVGKIMELKWSLHFYVIKDNAAFCIDSLMQLVKYSISQTVTVGYHNLSFY